MEELKQVFNETDSNHGKIRVENTYRGSAELLALYQISQIGDVLIAADIDYHEEFVTAKFCDATESLAKQFPCLIFTDVSQEDALSVLGNGAKKITMSVPKPKHAAIGRRVASILGEQQYEMLVDRANVSRETVSQVAADVSSGVVDVGVAWNTSSQQFSNLQQVIPLGWAEYASEIGVSVLLNSQRLKAAQTFVDFLSSAEAGEIFLKHGFTPSRLKTESTKGSAE